jgi:hypothetical protein
MTSPDCTMIMTSSWKNWRPMNRCPATGTMWGKPMPMST